jgi:hypothetical protein
MSLQPTQSTERSTTSAQGCTTDDSSDTGPVALKNAG